MNRRDFASSLGRFALVTPPAVTMLLSTSLNSAAIAKSGGNDKPRRSRPARRETRNDRNHGAENGFGR